MECSASRAGEGKNSMWQEIWDWLLGLMGTDEDSDRGGIIDPDG